MNKIKQIIQIIQGTGNGNGLAGLVSELRRRGFSMPEIRYALLVLKGIRIQTLAAECPVSLPTLTHTIKGRRKNPKAMARYASAVGLPVAELFPETDK